MNKIKVIKRIMYGRNSFELLKAKVLSSAIRLLSPGRVVLIFIFCFKRSDKKVSNRSGLSSGLKKRFFHCNIQFDRERYDVYDSGD